MLESELEPEWCPAGKPFRCLQLKLELESENRNFAKIAENLQEFFFTKFDISLYAIFTKRNRGGRSRSYNIISVIFSSIGSRDILTLKRVNRAKFWPYALLVFFFIILYLYSYHHVSVLDMKISLLDRFFCKLYISQICTYKIQKPHSSPYLENYKAYEAEILS